MRILFITDNFPPEVNAPATRVFEHCREWVNMGAEVTVLTCFPNFPSGVLFDGYKNRLVQEEEMAGIRVVRLWSYITANEGFVKRTLDYLSFAASALIAGLVEKADIMVATSPQFFTTWACNIISVVKRKPWVFELRDLWPESIKAVGALKDGKVSRMLERIELFLYDRADLIVALTDAFKENLVRRKIPEYKIKVVTNGSNLELFTPRERDGELARHLGLNGKFVVGYIGTHGMAHNLEFILNSLSHMQNGDFHFLFIGDGARKPIVTKLALEKKIECVTFLDPVRKEEVPKYLSLMDASLVPLMKSETFKTVIPSKIFEAAAMRIPVLLGVEGQAKKLVEGYDAGVCFEPENEGDFIRKLRLLIDDTNLYNRLQVGCKFLAENHDRKRLAQKMYGYLEETMVRRNYKRAQNA